MNLVGVEPRLSDLEWRVDQLSDCWIVKHEPIPANYHIINNNALEITDYPTVPDGTYLYHLYLTGQTAGVTFDNLPWLLEGQEPTLYLPIMTQNKKLKSYIVITLGKEGITCIPTEVENDIINFSSIPDINLNELTIKIEPQLTEDTIEPTIPVKIDTPLILSGKDLMEMLFKLCEINNLTNPWA
jgi:hypothetical protein